MRCWFCYSPYVSLSTNQLAQGVRVVLPLCDCCAIYFRVILPGQGQPVQESVMWWLMERPACWTSLTQLGRRSTVPWEISTWEKEGVALAEESAEATTWKGFQIIWSTSRSRWEGWDVLIIIWVDFMYDIVSPNLREIPGGVCACKKQNKVFFTRSLVWSWSGQLSQKFISGAIQGSCSWPLKLNIVMVCRSLRCWGGGEDDARSRPGCLFFCVGTMQRSLLNSPGVSSREQKNWFQEQCSAESIL